MGDISAVVLATEEGESSNFLLPNGTFFVIVFIFVLVLAVIGTFVVPPIMKVLRERENMVIKTLADNRDSAERFAAAEADYESEMSEARLAASTLRDDARSEGRRVIEERRSAADAEVGLRLRGAAEQLQREGDALSEELRARVEALSTTLASRILGVHVTAAAVSSGSTGR